MIDVIVIEIYVDEEIRSMTTDGVFGVKLMAENNPSNARIRISLIIIFVVRY